MDLHIFKIQIIFSRGREMLNSKNNLSNTNLPQKIFLPLQGGGEVGDGIL